MNKGIYNRENNIATLFFSNLEIGSVKWKNRINSCNLL